MARTPAQLNAEILANRQRNAPIFAERAARAKETGQDLRTVGRQMRDEAHQASLKRLYGEDLDTTNPAAVNAARAAKQAAAAQTRMAARQVRDNALNARVAAGEQDMPQRPMPAPQVMPTPQAAPMGAAQAAPMGAAQAAPMGAAQAAPMGAQAAPNPMTMKRGGRVKKMASGGMTSKVSSASKRGDGIAQRGKTRGRYI
jgi:hypothetical protein